MNTQAQIVAKGLFPAVEKAIELGQFSLARDLIEKQIAGLREHMNSLPLKDIRG